MNAGAAATLVLLSNPAPNVNLLEIDSPPANALRRSLIAELTAHFSARLNGTARCIVLTGTGDSFSAGGDLKDGDSVADALDEVLHLFSAVRHCAVPVVAAINGNCFGGGFDLALACDLRLAADTARFSCSGVNMGLVSPYQRLTRLLGESRASEILLTGSVFSAADLRAMGLLGGCYPRDYLVEEAVKLACRIATRAPLSIEATRSGMRAQWELDPAESQRRYEHTAKELAKTSDHLEAVRAFRERRTPVFLGN